MEGGNGHDFYYVDSAADTITEADLGGTDFVRVAAPGLSDYILPAYVENAQLSVGGTWLWGNGLSNDLTGTDIADVLLGQAGLDRLYGQRGNDTLRGGSDNDQLFGFTGQDMLYGETGDDLIEGGDGLDQITGGGGSDDLYGGAGSDTYIYEYVVDSGGGAVDWIHDFEGDGVDFLDLTAIDANTTVASDQAFTWVGSSTGAAGQAWYVISGPFWDIYLDVDGGGADMHLIVELASGTTVYGYW